jgi:hypothetical protein
VEGGVKCEEGREGGNGGGVENTGVENTGVENTGVENTGVENTAALSGEERERERDRVAQRRLEELGATSSTATLF